MNENLTVETTQNSDNGSVFSKNIVENEQKIDNFSKKEEKTVKNHTDVCKNDVFFDTECNTNIDNKAIERDPVSDISSHYDVQNNNANLLQLSESDEDKMFSHLFPGVKRENVENDRIFKIFAHGRSKSDSFTAIYSDYVCLVNEITENVRIKATYNKINSESSVGPLSDSERKNDSFFTKEQVLRMSREQIAKNYDKIRKSQANW